MAVSPFGYEKKTCSWQTRGAPRILIDGRPFQPGSLCHLDQHRQWRLEQRCQLEPKPSSWIRGHRHHHQCRGNRVPQWLDRHRRHCPRGQWWRDGDALACQLHPRIKWAVDCKPQRLLHGGQRRIDRQQQCGGLKWNNRLDCWASGWGFNTSFRQHTQHHHYEQCQYARMHPDQQRHGGLGQRNHSVRARLGHLQQWPVERAKRSDFDEFLWRQRGVQQLWHVAQIGRGQCERLHAFRGRRFLKPASPV